MVSTNSSDSIQLYGLKNFTFQTGVTLPSIRVAYREFNPTGQKTALIPTCFRGTINETLNFSSGVLQSYRVIVVALLGNGESSSPSNTANFPETIDYRDCVRAQHRLVTEHLQISSLDVMLGFSMGGQCTYYWTAMYPQIVRNAVIICSSARTSLHNYQFLEGPKAALLHSVDYNDEDLRSKNIAPIWGLRAFGRAYSAWLTSAEWFDERLFQKFGFDTLDEWAEAGAKGYDKWHPDDLLIMLRMWQKSDLSVIAGGGMTLEDTLRGLTTRILLMPCQTDQYFKWEANKRELQFLNYGELAVIPSIWGHIGGGGANQEDTEWMNKRIAAFLSNDH
ncbi:hypothetical protein N7520_004799 [Penicillium odoratum]|uniref:uncharacterized protein n=1 Tax=Penicillium odoratum TaxID=1167516 RepID=UPI002548B7A5|nr:uncharacterized protein N7520_004799 [Penicillium odoratum]KAJ5765240.1 hypothetical protein N7520_004799 [Penicillium odoratum]